MAVVRGMVTDRKQVRNRKRIRPNFRRDVACICTFHDSLQLKFVTLGTDYTHTHTGLCDAYDFISPYLLILTGVRPNATYCASSARRLVRSTPLLLQLLHLHPGWMFPITTDVAYNYRPGGSCNYNGRRILRGWGGAMTPPRTRFSRGVKMDAWAGRPCSRAA